MNDTRCGAIDVHTHIVPAEFPSYVGRHPDVAWPSMQHTKPCHANVMIAGKVFRSIDDRSWNVARRIEAMDEAGIDRQVLSPMPELLSYWFPSEDAAIFGEHVNGAIAEMIAAEPNRMVGLGMVPLQDVDLAIKTLETLVRKRGFAGVEIGTHVNGTPIGDPSLASFFAAAEDLSASIFVHALRPIGHERLVGPAALGAALLFPCDVALAASSVLTGGLIVRHPKLRLAFSHGGGAFGLLLPRLIHMWRTVPSVRDLMNENPRDTARRLYYDTLVYDKDTLAFLVERFGVNRLLLGSDYPYQIHDPDPVGRIDELALNPADRRALIRENAITFLGLEVSD
ncbi:MAG: aminocarboxymuconate-semialdehyde decarboxylase [Sneathiella sp.]|nr:MAG: aminocarboxymuconate-semialdehyde decarboxylase [Sneathiella sp.]